MARLAFDRYHGTMGNFALTPQAMIGGRNLADKDVVFYITQRKLPFAPCVGHERLLESLVRRNLDVPRRRFLEQDKAGLSLLAKRLESPLPFKIRTMAPGTIQFANEPFADIKGYFADVQMTEVAFEHAFDEPMTVASNALRMRIAAGPHRWLSDFSLRRDGSLDRACEIAKYAVIGGFNDTSNMEAAFLMDVNATGTMAHYLVQAFIEYLYLIDESGVRKHFQQVAYERWLDAHPNGTTLLLDTISVRLGVIHAIRAAHSSPERWRALRAVRIDSKENIKHAIWVKKMLDANGLSDVKIILTSDLDKSSIRTIVEACPFVFGFGVGTKLIAEVEHVAGVIFKLCLIEGSWPVLKFSDPAGKETLPGDLQVWRCVGPDSFYVKDVVASNRELAPVGENIVEAIPLLRPFWGFGNEPRVPTDQEQKLFVQEQLACFVDIDEYPVELSPHLRGLQESLTREMATDPLGTEGVIVVD